MHEANRPDGLPYPPPAEAATASAASGALPPRPIELEAAELSEKALRIISANTQEIMRIVASNAFGFSEAAVQALLKRIEDTELLCRRCDHFLLRCSSSAGVEALQSGRETMHQFEEVAAAARSAMAQAGCALAVERRPQLQSSWDEFFALSGGSAGYCTALTATSQPLPPLQMWKRRLDDDVSGVGSGVSGRQQPHVVRRSASAVAAGGGFSELEQAQVAARQPSAPVEQSVLEARLHEQIQTLSSLTEQLREVLELNVWGFSDAGVERVRAIEDEFREVAREARTLLQRTGAGRRLRASQRSAGPRRKGQTLRAAPEAGVERGGTLARKACGSRPGDVASADARDARAMAGERGGYEDLEAAVRRFGEVSELIHHTMEQTRPFAAAQAGVRSAAAGGTAAATPREVEAPGVRNQRTAASRQRAAAAGRRGGGGREGARRPRELFPALPASDAERAPPAASRCGDAGGSEAADGQGSRGVPSAPAVAADGAAARARLRGEAPIMEPGESEEAQLQLRGQQEDEKRERDAIALNDQLLEQRSAAIEEITGEVRQLSELFVELAALVEAQDEPTRLIEERLCDAAVTTDAARKEIEKAAQAQGGCNIA